MYYRNHTRAGGLRLLTVLFALACLHGICRGEDISLPFGEVVVTGEAVSRASQIEIDGEDIMIRDARTVDEALDFIQGVHVSVGNKNEPEVFLRGVSQDQVLVMVDGVPVSSPYYGYLDLSHISVNDIEKIKIIKGSASGIYGPNAMGGVINIITREPTEKTSYKVNGRLSGYNTMMGGVGYYKTFGKFNLSFAAAKDVSDGYGLSAAYDATQLNQGAGLREKSDYDKSNVSVKLGFNPGDRHRMALSVQHINSSKGIPPQVSNSKAKFRDFPVWKKTRCAFNDRLRVSDRCSVSSRIYYDRYDNSMDWYDSISYLVVDRRTTFRSYAVGTQCYADYRISDSHSIKASINARGDFHSDYDSKTSERNSYHANSYSLGIEDEMAYMDKILFRLSGSVDTFREDAAVSPVMNVIYNPDDKTTINLDVSFKTRFPTFNHLYNNDSGNTALTSQRNSGFEVGIGRDEDFLTGNLSLFINNVDGLIERKNKEFQYQNIAQAYMNGIEVSVSAELFEGFSCAVDYAFLVAKDRNPSFIGRNDNELPYIPASRWNFRVLYKSGRMTASLLGLVNGEMYSYDWNGNQEIINPYSLWNLRCSREVFNNTDISIALNNIFDVDYVEETGYPQPGRSLVVSFNMGI